MSSSPVLRMMVAMYLAIWSPALCCCAIKAGLGHVTGIEMSCGRTGCGSKASVQKPQEPPACPHCAPRANESDCCAAAANHDDQSTSQPQQDGGCKCHEKTIDRLPLDTGGKINLPALSLVLHSIFMLPAQGDLSDSSTPRVSNAPIQRAHAPPGQSLLAQHCALIV